MEKWSLADATAISLIEPDRAAPATPGAFLARAISAGRVEMPSDGETAINIGFSATNPIGKKSCGTWTGTFGLEKLLKAEGHMGRHMPHQFICQGKSPCVMIVAFDRAYDIYWGKGR